MKAVRDDFFSRSNDDPATVDLAGSRCRACGEVFLGAPHACANCQSEELDPITLGREGTLYSYTVVRNRPPGDYKGASDPFVPFPVGLVELPEGVRILCRVDAEIDALEVGMPLSLSIKPYYRDADDDEVLSFSYADRSGR